MAIGPAAHHGGRLTNYTLSAYSCGLGDNKEGLMPGKNNELPGFVELPPFERSREDYLDDDEYVKLQIELMKNPRAGDAIQGTGGLRKFRYGDKKRGKGKRGGLRIIFYFWSGGPEFWLFTVYDKDEVGDLAPEQKAQLARFIKAELAARARPNARR